MKKIFRIGIVILVMGIFSACTLPIQNTSIQGSGNVVREDRSVSGFTGVSLEGIGDLEIIQGDIETLTIEAEDNIIGKIESYVTGSTLHIGIERFINVIPTSGITYTLTVKDLNSIEISGYGDVYISSLTTDRLEVNISGGGRIEIDKLMADYLGVELSGAGDFDLAGVVDQQKITLSGAGSYKASDLQSSAVEIDISGAGSAQLWVTGELDVNLSGVGSLQYYGDAQVQQNISGIGKVIALGAHD
ncbi:MAG: head GIN domain-containing protein [Anaerolineaceae bacterium]